MTETLQTTPYELLMKILIYLRPMDIMHLFSANKNFSRLRGDKETWKSLSICRFGRDTLTEFTQPSQSQSEQGAAQPEPPAASPAEAYKVAHKRSAYAAATDLSIAWIQEPRYWTLDQNVASTSGTVATLHSVCWLDVTHTFKSVYAGTYRPIFRMRLTRGTAG
jgi:Phloem protein 2